MNYSRFNFIIINIQVLSLIWNKNKLIKCFMNIFKNFLNSCFPPRICRSPLQFPTKKRHLIPTFNFFLQCMGFISMSDSFARLSREFYFHQPKPFLSLFYRLFNLEFLRQTITRSTWSLLAHFFSFFLRLLLQYTLALNEGISSFTLSSSFFLAIC